MSSSAVVASSDAYVKALLHCYKFPTQPILGLLVGKYLNQNDGGCYVADAIPLFHTLQMSYPNAMVEIAYAHAQAAAKTRGLAVLGLYAAPEHLDDHSVPSLLRPVLDYLQARLTSGSAGNGGAPSRPLLWFVHNSTLLSPPHTLSITSFFYAGPEALPQTIATPEQTPETERLSFGEWDSDTLAPKPSGSAEGAIEAVGNALYAFAQYKIVDLEDHLEDPRLNYLDQPLAQLMRK